ncbi:hypothetical protein [Virgibacillus siamensis]
MGLTGEKWIYQENSNLSVGKTFTSLAILTSRLPDRFFDALQVIR